jgi:plastocyanin
MANTALTEEGMRVKIVSAGVFSIVLALAVGCSSDGNSNSLDLGGGGTNQVVVAKGGNTPHFDPDVIKVPAGTEVTFTFKNDDSRVHNFTVSYLGVDVDAQPGQSVPVKLTAPDRGTLNFYDKRDQGEGLSGKIEVS